MDSIQLSYNESLTLSLNNYVCISRFNKLFIVVRNNNKLFAYEVNSVKEKVILYKHKKEDVVLNEEYIQDKLI